MVGFSHICYLYVVTYSHHHSAIVRFRTVSVSLLIAFLPMLYRFSPDHVMMLSNHLYRLLPLFPFPGVFPSIVVKTRLDGLLFQWQYLLIFLSFTCANIPLSSYSILYYIFVIIITVNSIQKQFIQCFFFVYICW